MDFRTPRFSKIGPFKLPLHTGAHYRSGQSEIALPLRKSRFPTDASEMPLSPRQVCPVPSGSLYIPLILSASVRSGSVASDATAPSAGARHTPQTPAGFAAPSIS